MKDLPRQKRGFFKFLTIMFLIATFLLPFSLIGCAKEEVKSEKISVRLKWFVDISEAGLFVAKEKGFFKENGLDVTIHPGGFELDPVKLVVAGSADFGVTGGDIVLISRAKGLPIVAIAAEFQKTPVCFLVMADSGIKSPADFIGKKVGVKHATDAETVYRALLAKMKIDSKKIKEVPVKWDITPFLTGQVDILPGYVTNEPIVARQKGYKINVIKAEDFGLNFYGNIYFTTERIIKEKPEVVEKFVNSLVKGWEYALGHREESVDILLKVGEKLEKENQLAVYDAMIPYLRAANGRVCWMEPKIWEEMEASLREIGILEKPVEVSKAFDLQFLNKAFKDKK